MYKDPLKINGATKRALHIGDVSNSYILFNSPNGSTMYLDVLKYEGDMISFEVSNGDEYILNSEQWQYINDWRNCC